jgi:hypothetical protein
MPIPAARGGAVNDAGTLTIVVLPAQAPRPASRRAHEGRVRAPAGDRAVARDVLEAPLDVPGEVLDFVGG